MTDVANNHPILDPPFAHQQVERHLAHLLVPAREMATHAADLLLRLTATSPRELADMIVIATMFRQALSAYDGGLVLLENGAVQAAIPLNRTLLETSLGMEWMLKAGKDRWARQYYVSSLRQSLIWLRRGIPGTDEHAQYAKGLGPLLAELDLSASAVAQRQADESRLLTLLSKPAYSAVVAEIDQYRKPPGGKRRSEPNWYSYGSGGVSSLADIAKAVGRSAEYVTFYKYGSYFVHGSHAEASTHAEQGQLLIYPIRDLRQFPSILANLMTLMLPAIVELTQHYRAQELVTLRDTFVRWSNAAVRTAATTIAANVQVATYGA